jgi:hypothetical protein
MKMMKNVFYQSNTNAHAAVNAPFSSPQQKLFPRRVNKRICNSDSGCMASGSGLRKRSSKRKEK